MRDGWWVRATCSIGACTVAHGALVGCGDDPDVPLPIDAAVEVAATGCGSPTRGVGLFVAAGRVLTVAHVVAGADEVQVSTPSATTSATVIAFDPANDLAVLATNPAFAPAIPLGTADPGDRGVAVVLRSNRWDAVPVRIAAAVTLLAEDIYLDEIHVRPGYELEAEIVSGDSGAVVVVDQRAVAVVWARSELSDTRAWAVDASLVADELATTEPVSTGRCTH